MNDPSHGDRILGSLVLARYRVVRVLAQGGMGMVYLGRTEGAAGFSRPVVVKRILPHLIANPRMAGLFVREARILSELQHQGIVSILDFGEEDGAYLMVLEFVRGYDLGLWHRYLRETGGLMGGDVAIQVMLRVLEALHHAHTFRRPDGRALGIVHRDISPGNVLLDTEGHVKLLDFGIARFQDDGGEYRTRSGEFKGKAAYTPPEVFRGQEATAQADLFSAGVVLYKLLAGFNPFEGENSAQTMKRIVDLTPAPITHIRSDLPRELNAVLARALAKQPQARFATAAEFAEALRACRRATEEQAQAQLVAEIQRDFLGDMPAVLGLEPLPVLDAAWRAPSTSELHAIGETLVTRSDITKDVSTPKPPRSGRNTLALWLAAAGVVVAGATALGLALVLGGSPNDGPPVVVLQRNDPTPAPQATPPPAPPLVDQGTPPMPPAARGDPAVLEVQTAGRATAPRAPRARRSPGDAPDPNALTRSFRRHQFAIERCFEAAAAAQDLSTEVAVQFKVDTTGKVQSAETVPPSIGQTPLGTCLLKIARDTTFGPQPAPLAFRIPLRARQWSGR